MPKLVRQRWEADFGAFGGRKAKRGFSYDAYVPDELADLEFSLSADVAQAVAEAELLLTEVNRKGPALRALEALARTAPPRTRAINQTNQAAINQRASQHWAHARQLGTRPVAPFPALFLFSVRFVGAQRARRRPPRSSFSGELLS